MEGGVILLVKLQVLKWLSLCGAGRAHVASDSTFLVLAPWFLFGNFPPTSVKSFTCTLQHSMLGIGWDLASNYHKLNDKQYKFITYSSVGGSLMWVVLGWNQGFGRSVLPLGEL